MIKPHDIIITFLWYPWEAFANDVPYKESLESGFLSQLFHILLCDCVKNDRLYYHDKPCVNREKKEANYTF